MQVLGGTIRIVARNHGIDPVFAAVARCEPRPIAISVRVVEAAVIGLPEIDDSGFYHLPFRVEHPSGNLERNAGVAWGSQHTLVRSALEK